MISPTITAHTAVKSQERRQILGSGHVTPLLLLSCDTPLSPVVYFFIWFGTTFHLLRALNPYLPRIKYFLYFVVFLRQRVHSSCAKTQKPILIQFRSLRPSFRAQEYQVQWNLSQILSKNRRWLPMADCWTNCEIFGWFCSTRPYFQFNQNELNRGTVTLAERHKTMEISPLEAAAAGG